MEIKNNLNTVINLFEDGKNRYHKSPLFHKVVNMIVCGQNPYAIIDDLCKICDENQDKLENIINESYGKSTY